jgi:AGZA family xanthine/uracil permease-like MFS transporter
VLGPAFIALKQDGETVENAAMMTWYIGMATMVMIGVLKVIMSFCGNWIQKVVPRAGLLGSLAGVGLMLIGFMPLVDVFGLPLVGMISLGLILYIGGQDSTAEKHSRHLCSGHPGNRPLPLVSQPRLRRSAG